MDPIKGARTPSPVRDPVEVVARQTPAVAHPEEGPRVGLSPAESMGVRNRLYHGYAAIAGREERERDLAPASPLRLQGWTEDFERAREQSRRENKPLLVAFTGMDWCGWCQALERDVLSTSQFRDYASSKLVLMNADFPREHPQTPETARQNEALMKAFGVQGLPTLVVIRPDGGVAGRLGYSDDPTRFVQALRDITRA